MKNILSKIAKPLLIPALALSMSLKNADAQKLEFTPLLSIGGGASNYPNFKIYNEWQSHFKGLDGDEALKYKKIMPFVEAELGAELGVSFNKFSFGIDTRYSVAQAIQERSLSAIELHNWEFDYARIHEMTLKQKTPSLGLYMRFPIAEDESIGFRSSVRKADIHEIKREDKYFSSDSKCDPTPVDDTKDITHEFERTKYNATLNKMSIEYQSHNSDGTVGFELYYETDWKKVHELGFGLNLHFDQLW